MIHHVTELFWLGYAAHPDEVYQRERQWLFAVLAIALAGMLTAMGFLGIFAASAAGLGQIEVAAVAINGLAHMLIGVVFSTAIAGLSIYAKLAYAIHQEQQGDPE